MAAKGATTVMFRCRICQHEWTELRTDSGLPPEKSGAA
jgi:hypothetical protein